MLIYQKCQKTNDKPVGCAMMHDCITTRPVLFLQKEPQVCDLPADLLNLHVIEQHLVSGPQLVPKTLEPNFRI